MTFRSVEEVVAHAKLLEGKEFEGVHPAAKEVEKDHKGGFGHLVESVHFGVEPNSRSGPDIEDLGVEIKTEPGKSIFASHLTATCVSSSSSIFFFL